MRLWAIWSEGYRATGNESGAFLLGRVFASSFDRACERLRKRMLRKGRDEAYAPELRAVENGEFVWTAWGCRLFDNETDARVRWG